MVECVTALSRTDWQATQVRTPGSASRRFFGHFRREHPKLPGGFVSLGQFSCAADSNLTIVISNADTDGHVIVDAVQVVPVK